MIKAHDMLYILLMFEMIKLEFSIGPAFLMGLKHWDPYSYYKVGSDGV